MPPELTVYVVLDPILSKGRTHEEVAAMAIAGGASVIQLRDKQASVRELCEIGRRIKALTVRTGAHLIVNDRVDIALAVDADGVHLGQDDLPAGLARHLMGPRRIIGISVENGEQAARAAREGATYVAIGPIYEARSSKSDAGAPIGLEPITELRKHTRLPIVAIGGIDHERVSNVARAGADGAAVMSAIVSAPDIAEATREMKRLFLAAKA